MTADSHPGGFDANGCHNDRVHGGYHCHSGPLAGQSFDSPAEAQRALQGAPANTQQRFMSAPPAASGTAAECPCGTGKVCVGPRGGRFCITGSGSKRYGQ
ncbi:MAG: YHYH domain-containing protein [Rhodospirillales bacterium]